MAYDSPLMFLSLTLMPAEFMIIMRKMVSKQQIHEMPEVHLATLWLRCARLFDRAAILLDIFVQGTLRRLSDSRKEWIVEKK